MLASGETVPVDQDVLLGRAPFSVDRAGAHLVTLPSPDNDLSRTHVRVVVDGWLVEGHRPRVDERHGRHHAGAAGGAAAPARSVVLVPGTVINLADEALVRFEVPQ